MNNKIHIILYSIISILILSLTQIHANSLTLEEEILEASKFEGAVVNLPFIGNALVISANYSLNEFLENEPQKDVSELLINLKVNENSTISQIIFDSNTFIWVDSVNNWFNTQNGWFLNSSIENKLANDKSVLLDIYRNQQRVFLYLVVNINYFEGITEFNEQILQDLHSNDALNSSLFSNYQNSLEDNYTTIFFDSLTQNLPYSSINEFEETFEKILNLTLLIQEFDLLSNQNNLDNIIDFLNITQNITFDNEFLSHQNSQRITQNLQCYQLLKENSKVDLFNTLQENSPHLTLLRIENTIDLLCNILFKKKEIINISNSLDEVVYLNTSYFENLSSYYQQLEQYLNNPNMILFQNSSQKELLELQTIISSTINNISILNQTHSTQLFKDIKANQPYSTIDEIFNLIDLISNYYISFENIVSQSKLGEFSTSNLDEIRNSYNALEFRNISNTIHVTSNYNNTIYEEITNLTIKIQELNNSIDIISNININLINSINHNSELFNISNELLTILHSLLNFEEEVITLINNSKNNQFTFTLLEEFNTSLSNINNLVVYNKTSSEFRISQIIEKYNDLNISIENTLQQDLYANKNSYNYNYPKFEEFLVNIFEFRVLEQKLLNDIANTGNNQTNSSNTTQIITIIEELLPTLNNLTNSTLNSQIINEEYIQDLERKIAFIKEVSKKPRHQNILNVLDNSSSNLEEVFEDIWSTIEQVLNPILINAINENSTIHYNTLTLKGIANNTYFSIISISENEINSLNISTSTINLISYYEIIGFIPSNLTALISFDISSLNNYENFSILNYNLTQNSWISCLNFANQTINQTHISCETSHFSYWALSADEIIQPQQPTTSNPSSGGGGGGSGSSSNWNTPINNTQNEVSNSSENLVTNEEEIRRGSGFNTNLTGTDDTNQSNTSQLGNLTIESQASFEEIYLELETIEVTTTSELETSDEENEITNSNSLIGYMSLNAPSIIGFVVGLIMIVSIVIFFIIKK